MRFPVIRVRFQYFLVRPEAIAFGANLYFTGVYLFFFATRSPSSVSRSPRNL